eukprot:517483-Pleurochrysis_carterae.AAC.2
MNANSDVCVNEQCEGQVSPSMRATRGRVTNSARSPRVLAFSMSPVRARRLSIERCADTTRNKEG